MRILGLNAGRAAPVSYDPDLARPLGDGSAALVLDGRIACATIEERHARRRYVGGFGKAARTCLLAGGIRIEEVDAVGLSTCCDSRWTDAADRLDALIEAMPDMFRDRRSLTALTGKVHCIDHHDSHATLAFVGSGYRRGLVCVLDGFGNRRGDDGFHLSSDWWRGSFDRQTFYLAEWCDGRMRLERIHESATGPEDVGLAEGYRAITHFLGWNSYQHAGKTMALAGHGNSERFARLQLVDIRPSGDLRVGLTNRHDDPFGQVKGALAAAGYIVPGNIRRPATPDEPFLADLAARLQSQLEAALFATVDGLASRLGVRNVAFSGGLALNCVAMGKLAATRPDLNIHVPTAPSDTGQGLGNALWLAYAERSPVAEVGRPGKMTSAFLGPSLARADVARVVERGLREQAVSSARRFRDVRSLARTTATALAQGAVIGVRRGRSEYGPRALGNCSILADPRNPDARRRLDAIKKRETFRPFAASVLSTHQASCFKNPAASPFMSFAGAATPFVRKAAPGIVHVDGTTRYQTVAPGTGYLATVLAEFNSITGLPLVLNTSFNLSGEPMVETPEDVLDVMGRIELDAIVLGDLWLNGADQRQRGI